MVRERFLWVIPYDTDSFIEVFFFAKLGVANADVSSLRERRVCCCADSRYAKVSWFAFDGKPSESVDRSATGIADPPSSANGIDFVT
jgi:hypothetical protein